MARDCVAERITDVQRHVQFSPEDLSALRQFFAALVPPSPLAVMSVDQVDARLHKPAQRARTRAAALEINEVSSEPFPPLSVKAFQKREAYTSGKAARNITTVPQTHLIELGRYTYPLYDHLKTFEWFGAGRTPYEVSQGVARVCQSGQDVFETDFSRFDGTVGREWHKLVAGLFRDCFNDEHPRRVVLREVSVQAHNAAGPYDTAGSRLSGSPITTIGNTLINAAVSYLAARAASEHKEALGSLGLYAGDDGLVSGASTVQALEAAADRTGLRLKVTVRASGAPCSFLGRYYLDPANSPASMADLPRQLPKLVVTTDRQHPPSVSLYHKAYSWLITDPRTPILAAWAGAVVRLLKAGNPVVRVELLRYDARHHPGECGRESEFTPRPGAMLSQTLAWYPELDERAISAFETGCSDAKELWQLPTLLTIPPELSKSYRFVWDVSPAAAIEHQECKNTQEHQDGPTGPASSTPSRGPCTPAPTSEVHYMPASSPHVRERGSTLGSSSSQATTASALPSSASSSSAAVCRPWSSSKTVPRGTRMTQKASRPPRRYSPSRQRDSTPPRRKSSFEATSNSRQFRLLTPTWAPSVLLQDGSASPAPGPTSPAYGQPGYTGPPGPSGASPADASAGPDRV